MVAFPDQQILNTTEHLSCSSTGLDVRKVRSNMDPRLKEQSYWYNKGGKISDKCLQY